MSRELAKRYGAWLTSSRPANESGARANELRWSWPASRGRMVMRWRAQSLESSSIALPERKFSRKTGHVFQEHTLSNRLYAARAVRTEIRGGVCARVARSRDSAQRSGGKSARQSDDPA